MSNQIKLVDGIAWTTAWRSKHSKSNLKKAYLIPAQDLTGVLKEMGILTQQTIGGPFVLDESKIPNAGIRAYMAIDSTEPVGDQQKLLLVGTTETPGGDHNDIILNPTDPTNAVSGIYDFTKPCPSFCDKNSPLNK